MHMYLNSYTIIIYLSSHLTYCIARWQIAGYFQCSCLCSPSTMPLQGQIMLKICVSGPPARSFFLSHFSFFKNFLRFAIILSIKLLDSS